MNLPSFLWLWRIAAWSMGLSLFTYFLLAISGGVMFYGRSQERPRPAILRPLHIVLGSLLVIFVLLLLGIGIVGNIRSLWELGTFTTPIVRHSSSSFSPHISNQC